MADDTIYGTSGDDILSGGNGKDTIYGGDGDDIISGGNGIDRLFGDAGNDLRGFRHLGAPQMPSSNFLWTRCPERVTLL